MKKTNFITSIVFTAIVALFVLFTCVGDVVGSGYNVDLTFYNQENDVISITDLDVDVSVSKNNIATVTETFNVTFNEEYLSEVVRYVPYASYVYHETENGVEKKIHYSKIYDIDGSGEFGEKLNVYYDEEDGFLTIGLEALTGYFPAETTRPYTVTYKMDMGKDMNKCFDDVYFNIVGTNSLLTIENVTFRVTLPGDVSEAKSLKVYWGKDGSTDTLDVVTSGEFVTGTVDKLGPTEGITIRAVYEDGYLRYDKEIFASQIVSIIAAFIAVIMATVIMFKFTQRRKYARPVEVSAPENISPLNADVYLSGECGEKAISAGIVYLASKGYLKIVQHEDKKIELVKKKDADDNLGASEKSLFNAIFKVDKESVMLDDLSLDFFTRVKTIRASEAVKTKARLYDDKKKSARNGLVVFMLVAVFSALISLFIVSYEFFGFLPGVFGFYLVMMSLMLAVYLSYVVFAKNHWIFKIVCALFFVAYAIALYINDGYGQIDGFWLGFAALLLLAPLAVMTHGDAPYSKNGEVVKGRIEGFKDFILKCEVSQLKMFAEENPTYYFDVLPYAYVFGLSDVWMDKFKSIEVTIPDWVEAEGVDIVDIIIFNSMFNHFMITSHTGFVKNSIAMARSSSSSFGGFGSGFGGGGFGGGGFSGGGVGGGGFGAR